jgi:hypothetical protein
MRTIDDRDLDQMLRAAVGVDSPDVAPLLTRVRHAMRGEAVQRRRPSTTYVSGAVAAALFVAIVTGLLMIRADRNSALAVDAACDHFDELVQPSDKKWATAAADVDAYVQQHFPRDRNIVRALTPPGASFEKLASCRLLSVRFAHFVYRSEGRDISVFVRISDPSEHPVRRVDHVDRRLRLQVAGFITPRYEGLVVASVSSAATRQIADAIAAGL